MKVKILSALISICFILASALPAARGDEWYQGQPGMWHQHDNKWEWKGKHGDEWFQGKPGHWYAEPGNKWYWLGDDGREYREGLSWLGVDQRWLLLLHESPEPLLLQSVPAKPAILL